MNTEYLRSLPIERLAPLVLEGLAKAGIATRNSGHGARDSGLGGRDPGFGIREEEAFKRTLHLLQSRARTVKDFSGAFRAFFTDDFSYDPEAEKKFWMDAALPTLLVELAERLGSTEPFDVASTERTLRSLAEEKGVKAGLLINAARVALTGQAVAPSLFEVMSVLGKSRAVGRMRRAAGYLRTNAGRPTPTSNRG